MIHLVDFNISDMATMQLRSEHIEVTYGQRSPHGVTYIASANHYEGAFNPDPDYCNESSFAQAQQLAHLIGSTETFDFDTC